MSDSFNGTSSPADVNGTGGADIIYTGGGNDTTNAGAGADTVYSGDFYNENAKEYTKNVNLGAGSDTYYGLNGSDIVNGGTSVDGTGDTNNIFLGGGNDIYHGGNGADIVDGGTGNTGGIFETTTRSVSSTTSDLMRDSTDNKNKIYLGGGNDVYQGTIGRDLVYGGTGNNQIHLGRDSISDAFYSSAGAGETDTIWDFAKEDYVVITSGILSHENVGNDLHIHAKNGSTVIIKNFTLAEDEELPQSIIDDTRILLDTRIEDTLREPLLRSKVHAESQASPLILDLDGNGISTVGVNHNIYFDHDGNGFAENTGWVGQGDGLLVRDINGNGQIDNGSELFGDNTLLSDGTKASNGFEALKDLDSNQDNVFDVNDTAFNEVKVWKDTNLDGKVNDGELLSLAEAGITSINLDYQSLGQGPDENGNDHKQNSNFNTSSGSGIISDVWFDTEPSKTIYERIPVPADTLKGGNGNDTLIGGKDDDILQGGNGDDTYIYKLGDGFDSITDTGGNDKLVFEEISANDLSVEKNGNDLIFKINNQEDSGIKISNHFSSQKIETLEFSNGSIDISQFTNADQLIQALNSFVTDTSSSMDNLSNPTEDVSDIYSLAASQDLTRKAI